MAAVFLVSQATLLLRTGVIHRWLAFLTYPVALVLLFIVRPGRQGPPGVLAWVLLEASTSSSPISQATGSTMDQGSRRSTNPRTRIPYAICMFTLMLLAATDAGLALAI
jgi:hypothetical protein